VHTFNYESLPPNLLSSEIVGLLTAIREYKGKQSLYLEAKPDILSSLLEVAKIQSIDGSNRIEGIYTTDKRLREIVTKKAKPKNRNEEEIAGYRDALAMIHESYDYIEPIPSVILQLHRDLLRHTSSAFGGTFKSTDNVIAQIDSEGKQTVRFRPVSAVATPVAIEQLSRTYTTALSQDLHDPLLLACMYVFDFTCIHPFNDGNGRLSRLLTLLLLYRSGYLVGKYISIEKLIEQSKSTYYDALEASSAGWNENESNYVPFVRYMLGIILAAYREFEDRVEGLTIDTKSKAQRVEDLFDQRLGSISKRDILDHCPDISETTVERTLSSLLKKGAIKKVGAGRTTAYMRTGFNDVLIAD